jgi:hypothetical protein
MKRLTAKLMNKTFYCSIQGRRMHCIIFLIYIYIYKHGCMCVFVCSGITLERLERFRPNFIHIWLYVCVRILCMFIYIILSIIFCREDGVGGLHAIHPTPQGLPIAAAVTFTQIGIETTARYVVTFTQTGAEATAR